MLSLLSIYCSSPGRVAGLPNSTMSAPKQGVSDALPPQLHDYVAALSPKDRMEAERALITLNTVRYPVLFPPQGPDKPTLAKLAAETNAAMLHCSGNCVLLSACLLHNLMEPQHRLAVGNSYPIYEGFDSRVVEPLIFGQELESVGCCDSIDATRETILATYQETGQRFFVLSTTGYQLPLLGECGHALNAVVILDHQGEPAVQFVDAWKTSNPTPSDEELAARYRNAIFEIKCLNK